MDWIIVKKKPPTPKDSPILVTYDDDEFFSYMAVHWLSEEKGWTGEGWYDHSDEFWIEVEEMTWWMPLPKVPE